MNGKKVPSHEHSYWLFQNFEYSVGDRVSLEEIMLLRDQDKENEIYCCPLKKEDVFKILRSLFGDVRIYKPRIGGVQIKSFLNIRRRVEETYTSASRWILRSHSEDPPLQIYSKFCGTAESLNERVLKVEINPVTMAFTLHYNFREFCNDTLGLSPPNIGKNISALLSYLDELKLCSGMPNRDHNKRVIRHPKEDKQCITSISANGEITNTSLHCEQLILSQNDICGNCRKTQRVMKKRTPQYKNIMKTKNCLLNEFEKNEKIKMLKIRKKRLSSKLSYWKKKFECECAIVTPEDHQDYQQILTGIEGDKLNDNMKILLEQQRMALSRTSTVGYRWHPKIIRLCLDIYSTSPNAFDSLKNYLILPSKRLIRYYKNSVSQSSGWNPDMFLWCHREAKRLKLVEVDLWGGLVFDEMTIQEDLEFVQVNGKKKLVGAVSLGKTYEDIKFLMEGKTENIQLASKVMQFALVTDGGFRFALAHFPVSSMPAVSLLEKFWEGVESCERAGFRIYWILCDGGEPNRSFIKLLFPDGSDPREYSFTATNLHTGGKIVALADPKHVFKKIRNNLEKSTLSPKATRHLTINNTKVTFQSWRDAFEWDQQQHSLPLHARLTDDHFDLTPGSRMRNHLAEDILDEKMLFLMQTYQQYLKRIGKHGEAEALTECIHLLEYTSALINLFSRKDSISNIHDPRLKKAGEFLDFLENWKSQCSTAKEFLSDKLWFDIQSMIIGICQIVAIKTTRFPGTGIKPIIVNQDILENIFCQIRATNGQNNHPKYYMYTSSLISVNVGQTVISKKGNTNGNNSALPQAGLPVEHPFSHKRLSMRE